MPARRTGTRRTSTAKPAAVRPTPEPPVAGPGERIFVLSVPFDQRAVAAVNGARWNAAVRQTVYVGRSLPRGLAPYASEDYSWERWVEDDLNGTVQQPARGVSRMKPRPHQVEAAKKIAKAAHAGYRGFVEADDVGIGKTIATWCGVLLLARVRPVRNVLIMCPKGVVPHWRSTIAAVSDGGLRICVVNYDRAKNLLDVPDSAAAAKRTRTKNKQIASKGTSLVDWDVVIFDESQKLKNQGSQRRSAASRLARYAETAKTAPFVVWASATIGQNPVELGYLAPLLAQLTGAKRTDLADFGQWLADQDFCVTYNRRFEKWDWGVIPDDASPEKIAEIQAAKRHDIDRIYRLLFAGDDAPSIRRLPTDIAGWPEIQRILYPVALDAAERALYEKAWTEFRAAMSLVRKGHDPKGGLAARTRFRQKSSLLRVPGTVEHILDLLDNGHQVAVYCEWMETVDAIREGLGKHKITVAEFTGRNADVRESERLAFQRGRHKVVLFTVCEGFSLHQGEDLKDGTFATDVPRSTIVHDPRYSGIDSIQVEGRCHRDGKAANVYYMYGEDTVEFDIVRVLLGRAASTKQMQGDDVTVLHDLEAVLEAGSASDAGIPVPEDPVDLAANDQGSTGPVSPPAPVAPAAPALPRRPARPAPAQSALRDALAGGQARPAAKPRDGAAEEAALRRSLQGRG